MKYALIVCIVLSVVVTSCTRPINQYRVTDIQSRRSYIAVDSPAFLPGGAISFTDRDTKKMVTLQDFEIEGLEGEQYEIRENLWTKKWELVEKK